MTLLDNILERLTQRRSEHITLSQRSWNKSPLVVAGFTHLSRREQLEKWCSAHDVVLDYSGTIDCFIMRLKSNRKK